MRALLSRLREYRREKDFSRIKDAMEGLNRFTPRGDRGRNLLREIQELGETADWALRRKDELSQAISSELNRQNYEQVRDRLNEFDVLDDGNVYSKLRTELPWRIAERDILGLRNDVNTARERLAGKKPGDCRRLMDDIKARQLRISRLEAQFPVLKGVLTMPEPSAADAEPPSEFAKTLATASKDIDAVEAELASAEERIKDLMRDAQESFRAQDYRRCLALCRDIRELTEEPSPADSLVTRATAATQQIATILELAEKAIEERQYRLAERMARDVYERYKRDSVEADEVLARIASRRFRRNIQAFLAGLVCLAALYVASIGPAYYAAFNGTFPGGTTPPQLRGFYRPVFWLHDRTPLEHPLSWYANQWGVPVFNGR